MGLSRNFILTALLLAATAALPALAQTDRGTVMIAAEAGIGAPLNSLDRHPRYVGGPMVGVFFADYFAVGLKLPYSTKVKTPGYTLVSQAINPFVRAYSGVGKGRSFLEAGGGVYGERGVSSSNTGAPSRKGVAYSGRMWHFGPGFMYLMQEQVGVEFLAQYLAYKRPYENASKSLCFRAGVQVYLFRKKDPKTNLRQEMGAGNH